MRVETRRLRRGLILAGALSTTMLTACGGMMVEVGVSPRGGTLDDAYALDAGQPTLEQAGRASSFEENDVRVGFVAGDDGFLVGIGLSRWSSALRADPDETMSVYTLDTQFVTIHRLIGPVAPTFGLGFEASKASLTLEDRGWSSAGLAMPVSAGLGLFMGPVFVRSHVEYALIRVGGGYGFYETGDCLEGFITVGGSGGSACYRRDIVADSGLSGDLERLTFGLSLGFRIP